MTGSYGDYQRIEEADVPASIRGGSVQDAMERLEKCAEAVAVLVGSAQGRLLPVLAPANELRKRDGGASTPRAVRCPLTERLTLLADKLDKTHSDLDTILGRVDL